MYGLSVYPIWQCFRDRISPKILTTFSFPSIHDVVVIFEFNSCGFYELKTVSVRCVNVHGIVLDCAVWILLVLELV